MKDLFINSSFNFINKRQSLDHYNQVKIKYGLEVMYHFFTKLFFILILSIILNIFKNVLLTYFIFGFLRMFAYGMHAKSNIGCWISSTLSYILIAFVSNHIHFNDLSTIILFLLFFLSYVLWSPSDTKGKPIVSKKVRFRLKLLTITVFFIETLIFLNSGNTLKSIIILCNSLETFLINPFVKQLFYKT